MKLPDNMSIAVKGKTYKGGQECPDALVEAVKKGQADAAASKDKPVKKAKSK